MGYAVPAGFKSLLNDFPLRILTEMNGKQRASEMYRTCFKKCMDTPIFHPHVIIPEVSARMYFHSALVRSNTDVGDGGVSQLMFQGQSSSSTPNWENHVFMKLALYLGA